MLKIRICRILRTYCPSPDPASSLRIFHAYIPRIFHEVLSLAKIEARQYNETQEKQFVYCSFIDICLPQNQRFFPIYFTIYFPIL